MGLTEFFIDHIPGYNKFRAVTIILAVVEICVPILGVLFLQKLIEERDNIAGQMKKFFIVSGTGLVLLLAFAFTGAGDDYLSDREADFLYGMEANIRGQIASIPPQQLQQQYGIDPNNQQQIQSFIDQNVKQQSATYDTLVDFRAEISRNSYLRSFGFAIMLVLLIFIFLKVNMRTEILIGGVVLLVIVDLAPVDRIYLSSEKEKGAYKFWMPEFEKKNPFSPTQADMQIMQYEIAENPSLQGIIDQAQKKAEDKDLRREKGYQNYLQGKRFAALNANTNYRVYEPSGGLSSSRASYFHKSLGGYHGAKLRNIQNVFDFQLSQGTTRFSTCLT